MRLYCGIDLHARDHMVVVIDDSDEVVLEKRLPNELETTVRLLAPLRRGLHAIAVESTFNWYWLVDGLAAAGHEVKLVNTSAVEQYKGLKYKDDRHDARWLAHLMRLGLLPTGHIHPKGDRSARDLLRQRMRLVRQRTANVLSLKNLLARESGRMLPADRLKRMSLEELHELVEDDMLWHNAASVLTVMHAQSEQIAEIESLAASLAREKPELEILRTVPGIGRILSLSIGYETGEIARFPSVGHYASYCRCVHSEHLSAGKKKGAGNRKNGNPYLSWAYTEAAQFTRRYQPAAQRFYERKRRQRNGVVAVRALAHKLARACYFLLRDQVPYESARLFG
jgi:transposase